MRKELKGFKREGTEYLESSKEFIKRDFNSKVTQDKVYYDILLKYLKRSKRKNPAALEIGCYSGRGSCYVAKMFRKARVTGIDILQEAMEASKKTAGILGVKGNVFFKKANAEKLPFKAGSFDMVFSQGTFEHFKNISKIMKEQLRVLA